MATVSVVTVCWSYEDCVLANPLPDPLPWSKPSAESLGSLHEPSNREPEYQRFARNLPEFCRNFELEHLKKGDNHKSAFSHKLEMNYNTSYVVDASSPHPGLGEATGELGYLKKADNHNSAFPQTGVHGIPQSRSPEDSRRLPDSQRSFFQRFAYITYRDSQISFSGISRHVRRFSCFVHRNKRS